MNRADAQLLALEKIKRENPVLFARALALTRKETGLKQLAGLGASEGESFWDKLSGNLTKLGTTYLTLRNQKEAMEINLERARQGMPPLDIATTAPVVRTQIDLPPDVVNRITSEAGTGLNKILLFGGIAVIAVMLIKKMK